MDLRRLAPAALALLLGACAAGGPGMAPGPGAAAVPPQVEHGAALAQRSCARCHAIGPAGASPSPAAPPFRDVRLRYTPISLERTLARIAREGHYEMRPVDMSASDIPDIVAYIETLEPPAR